MYCCDKAYSVRGSNRSIWRSISSRLNVQSSRTSDQYAKSFNFMRSLVECEFIACKFHNFNARIQLPIKKLAYYSILLAYY